MTLKLRIENGIFTEVVGGARCFDSFSEDRLRAVGNGWVVTIHPPANKRLGSIVCQCEHSHSDDAAPYQEVFLLQDGDVGLSGGNVRKRYAYFRNRRFVSFLEERGIDSVRKENPNRCHRVAKDDTISIETDGLVCTQYGTQGTEYKIISDASWSLIDLKRDQHPELRLLYTLENDVTKLKVPILARIRK